MLREYYTTKPQAQFDGKGSQTVLHEPKHNWYVLLVHSSIGKVSVNHLQLTALSLCKASIIEYKC